MFYENSNNKQHALKSTLTVTGIVIVFIILNKLDLISNQLSSLVYISLIITAVLSLYAYFTDDEIKEKPTPISEADNLSQDELMKKVQAANSEPIVEESTQEDNSFNVESVGDVDFEEEEIKILEAAKSFEKSLLK